MERIRSLLAAVWSTVWAALLWLLIHPWRGLGGTVDERWIWAARFFTACLVVVGVHVGRWGREWAGPGRGRTHYAFHLRAWLAAAAPVAATIVIAALVPSMEGVLLTTAVFAGYWAGLDAGLAILPFWNGQRYTVREPLPPGAEDQDEDEDEDEVPWLPPWERL